MSFILVLGGGPNRFRYGFYYWQHPGAMEQYYVTDPNRADLGRFLSFFATLVNAAFSYGGVETVAVAAGEAENPRKNIPKAVRRVFWRILFFYVLGSLAIGMLVPYDDPNLLDAQASGAPGAAASPWVIAIRNAGIPVLDSIINVVILTSASSSGNAFLYVGSRYLYALAQNGQAPRFLLKCSKKGVPYYCVLCTAVIALLTYLSCGTGGAQAVFLWFQKLTTIASLFTWCSICVAYIKFYHALQAQGIDRNTLIFKSPFQPYLAWTALIFFAMIIIFNGFAVFNPFSITDFATAYVGIPIYFILYFAWKLIKRTKWIPSSEVDLFTGKAALDAADGHWPNPEPRNIFERFWFWLA